MSAKYPEVFYRPYNKAIGFGVDIFMASKVSTRLHNILQGVFFKISPGVQKTMNRGQTRTLSEKISVEIKLAFIDQDSYNQHRDLINQNIDLCFFDPEDPSGMFTAFRGISLSVKAELEGGDGYTVILGADHEVSTGTGVVMRSEPTLRLATFYAENAGTGAPLRVNIPFPAGDAFTASDGHGWFLGSPAGLGDGIVEVELIGAATPDPVEIDLSVLHACRQEYHYEVLVDDVVPQ